MTPADEGAAVDALGRAAEKAKPLARIWVAAEHVSAVLAALKEAERKVGELEDWLHKSNEAFELMDDKRHKAEALNARLREELEEVRHGRHD